MMNRKMSLVVGGMAACVALSFVFPPLSAEAQAKREKKQEQGREMTFVGKIVDVHHYMLGKYPSDDHAKSTADAIRAGVPVAIDTPAGLIVIGQGTSGASKTLIPLAFTRAKVSGKYYEKNGVKYLDLASAQAAANDAENVEPSEE